MAEIKTGLEIEAGFLDQTGTLGKVYYHSFIGSAGTKACGVGTKANTGTRAIHVGSGLVFCSGKAKIVGSSATGTMAASASAGSFTTYNVEVGSDTTLDITTGAEGSTVAAAIAGRAGTKAAHAVLAYLTVDNNGSLIAGSIVNDRTLLPSTGLNYGQGISYEISDNPIHIWNGPTYAHSKKQRKTHKVTLKQGYIGGSTDNPWNALDDATNKVYMTVPRCVLELDNMGIAGTTSFIDVMIDCVEENQSVDVPEEEASSREFGAFFGSRLIFK